VRSQSSRGRRGKIRKRGHGASRAGRKSGGNRGTISSGYGFRARHARRVRCGDRAVSRCGDDGDQGRVFRKRHQHHTRTSFSAHVTRSRYGAGHRGSESRRPIEHDRGYASVRVGCTSRSPVRRSPIVWRSTDRDSIRRPSISRTVKIAPPAMTRSPMTGNRPSTPNT
jgi:hypothetical protein